MKRFYYLATALLVLAGAAGCKKNADVQEPEQQSSGRMIPFTVTAGQGGQKTSMVEGVLSWNSGDKIVVMKQDGTYPTSPMTLTSGAGTAEGSFEGTISENVKDGDALYGLYNATYSDGNFTVTIPASQEYAESSFQPGIFPSIGTGTKAENTAISFAHPMGILRLRIKGVSTVTSIKLTSGNKNIAGSFSVSPSLSVSGGTSDEITMTFPSSGVELNMAEDPANLKYFCFVVPPVTFDSNDAVEICFKDGRTLKRAFSTSVTVSASGVGTALICDPCENHIPTMHAGVTMTDQCGQTYKTVVIGTQTWMAENLHCLHYSSTSDADAELKAGGYTIPTSSGLVFTPYYAASSVTGGGYYYNWAAVVGVNDGEAYGKQPFVGNRQGLCPNGWHVPTSDEWDVLSNYIKAEYNCGDAVGKYLKVASGWAHNDDYENLDCFGFAAIGAGHAEGSTLINVQYSTDFWSATPFIWDEYSAVNALFRNLGWDHDNLNSYTSGKDYGQSLRCVQN